MKFTALWQTALAVPLAFIIWMLGILIGGGLFAFFIGFPVIPENDFNKVWLLSAAAWIGIWAAYHVCEWLFKAYSRWAVFLVLTAAALLNFIGEFGQPVFWDVIARGAQSAVTCLTAYVFFIDNPERPRHRSASSTPRGVAE